MTSRNTTTTSSSTIRTDYGSTTLKISIDNNTLDTDSASIEDNIVGVYQSLPYTSTTNLYAKSSMSSRFSKMTVDTMSKNEAQQIGQRIEYLLNVINRICIGFVTIYMSWMCLRMGLAGTALHAWLVTIGFSFLMAEAIMCHYNHNVLTFNYRRTTKTTMHWMLQSLGGACGIAGVLIKCIQKGFLLQSTHGKLGFAAFILCCISMLSGLAALYSVRVKKFLSPLLNKTFHNVLGIATFAVALVAHFYGYNTGFFSRKSPSNDFTILMKVLTLMTLCLSSWGPLKSLLHKMRSIIKTFS
uniref:ascorbate ferrireductase (transmembrane) n=1 Tax=Stomoxys calcitrans TaxID=35570 RepID=A0A1I8QCY6_STOCA